MSKEKSQRRADKGPAPLRPPGAPRAPRPGQTLKSWADRIRWPWIIGIGTALLLFFSRRPLYGLILIDDSFITYTYSKNLVEHGQFVFNLGEKVLATTTPLYALLGSIFYLLGADLFYAAPIFNLVLDGVTAWFAWLVIRQIFQTGTPIIYTIFAILFFLQPYEMLSSAGGMETSLYILLTVMVVWAGLREQWALAGVIAALLMMTRPDGVIIGACVFLYYLIQKRAFPGRGFLAFLITLAPWIIFSSIYYGSPIPSSVQAKLVLGKDFVTPVKMRFLEVYYYHYKRHSYLLLAATFIGLAGMGWAVYQGVKEKNRRLIILAVFFILFNCAFMLTQTAIGWFWYYIPLYLVLYIYAGYLCREVIARFRPAAVLVAGFGLAVLLMASLKYLPAEYHRFRLKSISWDRGLRQPCLWVAQNTPAHVTLMCQTVGLPGYYANRRIIDPLCIASPELLSTYPGKEKAELETLKKTQPDYFISWEAKPQSIPSNYSLVKEYTMPVALIAYHSTWLYKRNEPGGYPKTKPGSSD